MKVAHWVLVNGSGMHRVAETMVAGENKVGIESTLVDISKPATFDKHAESDIHVVHTHLPIFRKVQKAGKRVVWVGHGTPENVFMTSVENGLNKGYGYSDPWMLMMFWLQNADAVVTFWDRHEAFYRSMSDKHRDITTIPLGIEDFWCEGKSNGKFVGTPSVLTAENCHYIKWPLDLFIAWGHLTKDLPDAVLHAVYLPRDQHRWFFPLVNRNGCSYSSHISGMVFDKETLRNAFRSVDYYCGLVRYGDHNRVCLEAKACGCKVISYRGNPYADYHVSEGNQVIMAAELEEILRGEIPPNVTCAVPRVEEMVSSMVAVYERIL